MKNTKKKKSSNYGVIINLLFVLYSFFARCAKNSLTNRIFLSNEKTEEKQKNSFFSKLYKSIFPKDKTLKIRRKVADVISKMPVIRHGDTFIKTFIVCRCRDYGVFFLSFGIYSFLGCTVGGYFLSNNTPSFFSYVACAVSVLISFPLLKEKRSLGYFANNSAMAQFIFFDVLGARRHEIYPAEAKHAPAGLALLLGMGFGLISFISEPYRVFLFLLFSFLTIWILHTPEAGVIVICLIFPFLGTVYTAYVLLITFVSYFLKLLQLKRTGKFGYIDFWVILLSFVFLTGASRNINGETAAGFAFVSFLFVLSFILVKNLICSFEWIKRFFMSCIFSLTGVAFFSLIQIVSANDAGIVSSLLYSARSGISCVFDDPDVLALYILCLLPMLFTMMKKSDTRYEKRISNFIVLASVFALLFTVSFGGYVSFFITFYVVLLVYSKKTFAFATLSLLPVSTIAVIVSKIEGFTLFNAFDKSDLISYAAREAWEGTLAYPVCGSGIRGDINVITPFYLCITSQLGIPCLIVLFIIIFEFFKRVSSCIYSEKANVVTAKYSYFAASPAISVFAILIFGLSSSAPATPVGILLLFMLIGFGFGIHEYVMCENDSLSCIGTEGDVK